MQFVESSLQCSSPWKHAKQYPVSWNSDFYKRFFPNQNRQHKVAGPTWNNHGRELDTKNIRQNKKGWGGGFDRLQLSITPQGNCIGNMKNTKKVLSIN